MKLLLYCTKGKVGLYDNRKKITGALENFFLDKLGYDKPPLLNGKIGAECDFEVEEIYERVSLNDSWFNDFHHTKTMKNDELLKKSCLKVEEMNKYFDYPKNTLNKVGYAIHIKNLHIFDEPRELAHSTTDNDSYYYTAKDDKKFKVIRCGALIQAPQNMRYVQDYFSHKYALISIHPEWLCKILNGEKTIEVRKKVLKGMLENGN